MTTLGGAELTALGAPQPIRQKVSSVIMRARTKAFALRVLRLVNRLPSGVTGRTIGHQILRSGTSVGANYRSACRARSRAEFISRMGIVEEECDETIYWLELLVESGLVREDLLSNLIMEAGEILAIVVASIRTARRRQKRDANKEN